MTKGIAWNTNTPGPILHRLYELTNSDEEILYRLAGNSSSGWRILFELGLEAEADSVRNKAISMMTSMNTEKLERFLDDGLSLDTPWTFGHYAHQPTTLGDRRLEADLNEVFQRIQALEMQRRIDAVSRLSPEIIESVKTSVKHRF